MDAQDTRLKDMSRDSLEIDFPVVETATWSGLLKTTLKVFFENILLIAKIVIVVALPVELVKNYYIYAVGLRNDQWHMMLIDTVVFGIVSALIVPALYYALIEVFRNGTAPSLGSSYKWGFRRYLRVFGNRLIAGAWIGFGLVFLVIPGVVFCLWYMLIDPISSIEASGEVTVLQRSRTLTRGHRWMLYASGFMVTVLYYLAATLIAIPIMIVDNFVTLSLFYVICDVLLMSQSIMVLLAYLYFSAAEKTVTQKHRLEGFPVK